MTPISAVIITFNEERNIAPCLESLAGVADEIIVVDSFSTDATAEICRSYNVNFVQHPFENYADQKNFGNSLAQHAFILSLDADEVLSDTLKESVLKWKKSGSNKAMQVYRLTNYCGKWIKHCGWYPDAKYRLFDKSKARWAGEKVHEFLDIDAEVPKGKLDGDLLHYSYHSIRQHIDTINKYSELKAEIMFENGKSVSLIKILIDRIILCIYFERTS